MKRIKMFTLAAIVAVSVLQPKDTIAQVGPNFPTPTCTSNNCTIETGCSGKSCKTPGRNDEPADPFESLALHVMYGSESLNVL